MSLAGDYDWKLVGLSLAIAIIASYAAFELAAPTAEPRKGTRAIWRTGGAAALGLGIWATHYIGMLALRLPTPMLYHVPTVIFSLSVAIGTSWVALTAVSQQNLNRSALLSGGGMIAVGVATLHYSGTLATRMAASETYNFELLALSLVISVVVYCLALHLAFRFRGASGERWNRLVAAVVMGIGIAAVHYAGVEAVGFHQMIAVAPSDLGSAVSVTSMGALVIGLAVFAVLALCVVAAMTERRFAFQQRMLQFEEERWRMVIGANQGWLVDVDLLSGEVFRSPQWLSDLGYKPDDPDAPKQIIDRMHPDDRIVFQAAFDDYVKSGGTLLEIECRLAVKEGDWRWFLIRILAKRNEHGRAIRVVGLTLDITTQKQALEKLMASEARFTAFMDHNPYMGFIKNADGQIVYTNRTLEKRWNLRPGEWLGRRANEIWPARLANHFEDKDLAALSSDTPVEYVDQIDTPEGKRWFLTTSFAITETSGKKAVAGIAVDITERMESEAKIRTSEARYRELFEQNPSPICVYCTNDFRILDVNEAAIQHYGWTREQFLSLTASDIRVPGECEEVESKVRQAALENRPTKPVRHRRNNKSDIWVELSSHEIEFDGVPARLIMATDITARLAAEDENRRTQEQLENLVTQRTSELRESEAKWRGLVESLPQFVWSTSPDGKVEYMSHQWAEYSGVEPAELLGLGWLDTLHAGDRERVQRLRMAARAEGQNYDVEYRIRAKDGSYRWFVARSRAIRALEDGPITHWLGTSTDIEDQKRSEERLETAVAERTQALAEARDRAECAAQAKSAFLAAMSHEIRTPMNGVIGMTDLLLGMPLTSEQRGYVDTIRSSGEALLMIINDVLDFSKIEAGKIELESAEFDLQTLLEESMELVGASAAIKNLRLSLNIKNDVPHVVRGDPGRLRQIFLNLLSNAVKFTERGFVAVSVSRAAMQNEVMMLRFTVRDTGIGMTPEQQSGLFQAFSQADLSTTRRFGGTGLGLSIAKRLVELMGGTIGVSSRLGDGATFWFNICIKAEAEKQYESLRGRRVLIIDDETRSLQTVRGYLERVGMQVLSPDGDEGKWSANTNIGGAGVSLIVVDAVAPGTRAMLTGLIRQFPSSQFLAIVLGTPSEWPLNGLTTAIPVFSFIPKPARCVPLLQTVQRAVSGSTDTAKPVRPEAQSRSSGSLDGSEILLVEDNPVNQRVATLLLRKLGCKVDVAQNGREACEAMKVRGYDLVFMDCQMPDMDGFEATRIIRTNENGLHRTPIIALTAGVLKEERDHCYEAGMDGFLSKPVTNDRLRATLENWLVPH